MRRQHSGIGPADVDNRRRNRSGRRRDRSTLGQSEACSLLDVRFKEYRKTARMAVANVADRRRWKKTGVRNLIRKSKLSQQAVYAILNGQPVRASTLAIFQRAIDT